MSHHISQSMQHRVAMLDDTTRHAMLMCLATSEARRLHRQAVSEAGGQLLDHFWRDGNHVWARFRTTAARATRSSQRFQSRLARHLTSRHSA